MARRIIAQVGGGAGTGACPWRRPSPRWKGVHARRAQGGFVRIEGRVAVEEGRGRRIGHRREQGMDVAKQQVRVGVTRAGKKGKSVTCVDGMDVGTAEEARELVKTFKRVLGVGGVAAANGSLQFQGDNAAVLCEMLVAMGYKRTKQTGGVVVKRK